ncbi:MAG: tRNA preQ1(34) S-adenosylmethionine ribosyltransferase-isomerase QueA [bacterium]|nr:tRNA preQ1(34) S-adenosylmethionine ribosyltransferase-isomerase QueA [bacterium]
MKNDLYYFDLPQELIAQTPAKPRDSARLLVYDTGSGNISDKFVYDLPDILPKQSTVVVNNSKVNHCRWLFESGKTELFVIEKSSPNIIRALARPGRKFKVGSLVCLNNWLTAKVLAIDSDGIRTLELNLPHTDIRIKKIEHIPLPPYIAQNDNLAEEYQTVFAKKSGSVAAPTAGLHFTEKLLHNIKERHDFAEITLHVGLGTFAKLTEKNIETGKLHSEHCEINAETADILNRSSHITAVGTTTARTLETMLSNSDNFVSDNIQTDIFIRPGYRFKAVDSLITNFHLPSTSLLMLVAAFISDKKDLPEHIAISELQRIYAHAINQKYRFYSFGDAMIVI